MNWSSRNTTVITRPRRRVVDEVLGPQVGGRAAQHEADLVGDAGGVGLVGHAPRACSVVNASGFSQNTCTPGGDGLRQQARVLVGPRADVDGVAAVDAPRPRWRTRVWPLAAAKAVGALGVGVVHAGAHDGGAAAPQALRVVGGDQPGAQEADPSAGSRCTCHGRSACQTDLPTELPAFDAVGDGGGLVDGRG